MDKSSTSCERMEFIDAPRSPFPMSRQWAMPTPDTFDCKPIGDFVRRYLKPGMTSIDPFARNKRWCTHTNDLNPETLAEHHMDAIDFCLMLQKENVRANLAIIDPPYSNRQISECYKGVGRSVTTEDTQLGRVLKEVRQAIHPMVEIGGIVLSFGWNSCGMGIKLGYRPLEIMLVAHGGSHSDTICLAEIKDATLFDAEG